MKKREWENPNKMRFESEFKTFNKQVNLITTGNAICNTQMSMFIRPYKETKCNGFENPEGHLMRWDLQYFSNIPQNIRKILEDKNRQESYILYRFFIHKNGEIEDVGYVVTDYNHNYVTKSIICYYGSNYQKRESAINECIKYICN